MGRFNGRIRPPGSKSITNRALVCAALADGRSTLDGALDSEDTQVMIESLRRLGLAMRTVDGERSCLGLRRRLSGQQADLFVGNSGTTMRFLTAMLATAAARFRLDGWPRMRSGRSGICSTRLRQLGGDAVSELGNGCPPVVIHAARAGRRPGRRGGDISSQFLSGLLMACPYARRPM